MTSPLSDFAPFQAVVPMPPRQPVFALGIRCDRDSITEIVFLPPEAASAAPPATAPIASPLAALAARQLAVYAADPTAPLALPLAPAGTPFQRRVWAGIATIPPGQTTTYGALAQAIHSAPRAVGGACGANPYPLAVPCHRVVAANVGFNDGLGGFARERGGFLLAIKRWLLTHEGILSA